MYRDLRDKARLKIKIRIRRLVQSPDGKWYQMRPDLPVHGATEKLYVVVSVTNIGRRPIKWEGWGGDYHKPVSGKPSFQIIPTNLPVMLNEGDSCEDLTDDLEAAGNNVKRLYVYDASGKNWYLSRKAMWRLKKEYREFRHLQSK